MDVVCKDLTPGDTLLYGESQLLFLKKKVFIMLMTAEKDLKCKP